MRTILLRCKYYLGKFCAALGFCRRCGTRLNFTRHGQGICPHCGSRY